MKNKFMFTIFLFCAVILIIDLYAFKGIRVMGQSLDKNYKILVTIGFWVIPFITIASIFLFYSNRKYYPSPGTYKLLYFAFGFFVLLYIPKLIFLIFHITDDVISLISWFGAWACSAHPPVPGVFNTIRHSVFITRLGAIMSTLALLSILWGLTLGKFNFQVKEVPISFENLPEAFDGFTVVQISDLHIESYNGRQKKLEKIAALVNKQNPDIIVFTGDMVNHYAEELDPFIPLLDQLKARLGKYSILGNHDYGDYVHWDSDQKKYLNMEKLLQNQKEMGFRVLLNESIKFKRDSSEIALIGVENWGNPPFPQYGNLKKAMEGVQEVPFKILLSHDPSHWDAEVLGKTNVALTLSGHTHGMQFGIKLPGIRWSPVQWKYPRWQGLYKEGPQYLYVNLGLGLLALPGRIGSPPEITVFKLKKTGELK